MVPSARLTALVPRTSGPERPTGRGCADATTRSRAPLLLSRWHGSRGPALAHSPNRQDDLRVLRSFSTLARRRCMNVDQTGVGGMTVPHTCSAVHLE